MKQSLPPLASSLLRTPAATVAPSQPIIIQAFLVLWLWFAMWFSATCVTYSQVPCFMFSMSWVIASPAEPRLRLTVEAARLQCAVSSACTCGVSSIAERLSNGIHRHWLALRNVYHCQAVVTSDVIGSDEEIEWGHACRSIKAFSVWSFSVHKSINRLSIHPLHPLLLETGAYPNVLTCMFCCLTQTWCQHASWNILFLFWILNMYLTDTKR